MPGPRAAKWLPKRLLNLLKDPLVHFLALGLLLFVVHAFVADPSSWETDKTIRISEGDVRRLTAAWELQWRRPPSKDELTNLIREHVREEILYREALALGLDQDDSIVRRRLAQKMQFLSEDMAAGEEPSEAALQRFFEQHPDRFKTPATATFTHIYFSPDKRGAHARADAEQALKQLKFGANATGDRFMLQKHYAARSAEQVAGLFGASFAEDLFALPVGSWQGPLKSGYGLHLVRVENRTEASLPLFQEAQVDARAAWVDENRREANDRLYERLREDYRIEIGAGVTDLASEALQ